jgi:hypothetical protein
VRALDVLYLLLGCRRTDRHGALNKPTLPMFVAFPTQASATLVNRGGSQTVAPTANASPPAPSVADANADAMRLGLLEGVILPLAATRQGFANGDMFYLALRDWSEVKAGAGETRETPCYARYGHTPH